MNQILEEQRARLRSAVSSGDFASARAALDRYAKELERAANATDDGATLARLESDWNDLVGWARSMAATARELARSEWARIRPACPYRPVLNRRPSILSARG